MDEQGYRQLVSRLAQWGARLLLGRRTLGQNLQTKQNKTQENAPNVLQPPPAILKASVYFLYAVHIP